MLGILRMGFVCKQKVRNHLPYQKARNLFWNVM